MNKKRGTIIILFFLAGSVDAVQRGELIPGIDPITRATPVSPRQDADPDYIFDRIEEGQPVPGDRDRPVDGSDRAEFHGQSAVQNLHVARHPSRPSSARITWDYSDANDSAVYVARFSRPINSRERLMQAYNLTSPPLDAATASFDDIEIPEGTYYYAVVTAHEVSPDGQLQMVGDVNYTTDPFVVLRSDQQRPEDRIIQPDPAETAQQQQERQEGYRISNLTANNGPATVKLNWMPVKATGILYNIYRSNTPIRSAEDLRQAELLGQADEQSPFYEDSAPLEGRPVYYMVTVTHRASGSQVASFIEGESVIVHTFTPQMAPREMDRTLPDALTGFLYTRDTVRLLWVEPEEAAFDYRVYRHHRPITDSDILERAEFAGTVSSGNDSFEDPRLTPGQYFYALIPRDNSGQELRLFEQSRTFTGYAVTIRDLSGSRSLEPPVDSIVATEVDDVPEPDVSDPVEVDDLDAFLSELITDIRVFSSRAVEDGVLVEWEVQPQRQTEFQNIEILLFRSRKPFDSLSDLQREGVFIDAFDMLRNQYSDRPLAHGEYYYTMIFRLQDKVKNEITGHQITGPVRVRPEVEHIDESSEQQLKALDRILSEDYLNQNYGRAVERLLDFLDQATLADSVRNRALFYLGLAYYHDGKPEVAVEYFLNRNVQADYPDRARFWYHRSLELLE